MTIPESRHLCAACGASDPVGWVPRRGANIRAINLCTECKDGLKAMISPPPLVVEGDDADEREFADVPKHCPRCGTHTKIVGERWNCPTCDLWRTIPRRTELGKTVCRDCHNPISDTRAQRSEFCFGCENWLSFPNAMVVFREKARQYAFDLDYDEEIPSEKLRRYAIAGGTWCAMEMHRIANALDSIARRKGDDDW